VHQQLFGSCTANRIGFDTKQPGGRAAFLQIKGRISIFASAFDDTSGLEAVGKAEQQSAFAFIEILSIV